MLTYHIVYFQKMQHRLRRIAAHYGCRTRAADNVAPTLPAGSVNAAGSSQTRTATPSSSRHPTFSHEDEDEAEDEDEEDDYYETQITEEMGMSRMPDAPPSS